MKRIFILLCAACTAFASCSKDDPPFAYDKEMIYGTWVLDQVYLENTWVDIDDVGLGYTAATFLPDGTYLVEGGLGDDVGVYKFAGSNVVACSFPGYSTKVKYEIRTLTDTRCEFKMTHTEGIAVTVVIMRCIKELPG